MAAALQQGRSQLGDSIRQRSAEEHAKTMLERARWAAAAFANYDRDRTLKIAHAVADAGFAKAGHYGDWAVKETGFGVAEHKKIKNELCSRGIYEHYKDELFVGKRIDYDSKIVEIARPAGVDGLFQDHVRAADAQRHPDQPASPGQGLLRRCGEDDA